MNQIDLNKNSEDQRAFKPEALAIGIGAVAVIAIAYLLKDKKSQLLRKKKTILPTKPPPIIIKSGSFIIDSVAGFIDNSGDITGNPKRKKINKYKGNFGVIKSVLVNQKNERNLGDTTGPRPRGYPFADPEGVIIKLWFQKLINEDPERWDLTDVTEEPDVVNVLQSDPLKLELPGNLDNNSGNKHHKRKNKDKLDFKGTDIYFRIGRIRISNHEDIEKYDILSIDGDEYYISLWDE